MNAALASRVDNTTNSSGTGVISRAISSALSFLFGGNGDENEQDEENDDLLNDLVDVEGEGARHRPEAALANDRFAVGAVAAGPDHDRLMQRFLMRTSQAPLPPPTGGYLARVAAPDRYERGSLGLPLLSIGSLPVSIRSVSQPSTSHEAPALESSDATARNVPVLRPPIFAPIPSLPPSIASASSIRHKEILSKIFKSNTKPSMLLPSSSQVVGSVNQSSIQESEKTSPSSSVENKTFPSTMLKTPDFSQSTPDEEDISLRDPLLRDLVSHPDFEPALLPAIKLIDRESDSAKKAQMTKAVIDVAYEALEKRQAPSQSSQITESVSSKRPVPVLHPTSSNEKLSAVCPVKVFNSIVKIVHNPQKKVTTVVPSPVQNPPAPLENPKTSKYFLHLGARSIEIPPSSSTQIVRSESS
eukprot:GILI01017145.1.p1 GENE.GILI01017145.1~~GILI01017145.1.p1  ORF type:complete len:459 (+),score=56.93 GILI01017145.1:133-1377(+)